ncbi:MAG: hypothetical protein ACRDMY_15860 [Gaiellaceae bacterium]
MTRADLADSAERSLQGVSKLEADGPYPGATDLGALTKQGDNSAAKWYSPIPGDEALSLKPNGWIVQGFYTGEGDVIVRPWVVCAVVKN